MENAEDDLYSILNLPPASTDGQLRIAFCELLQKYHPDRNPDAIEMATRKTQEIIMAYSQLRDLRKREPSSGADTFEAPGISLDLIASLKREFLDAWNAFNKRQYDVMAALRLIRAAFDAGRADVVDDLVTNPQLIDAASILAHVFSPDDAAHVGLMWSWSLRTKRFPEAAIQVLSDLNQHIPTDSEYASPIRDSLRSLHYGIAQGHNSEQKPAPATRIHHLKAILDLGFEFGYIYKQLAEVYHDLGEDDVARAHLRRATEVDPQLSGAKTIMRALGMASENAPKVRRQQRRDKYTYSRDGEIPTAEQIVSWFRHSNWEPILERGDYSKYSPRILPHARFVLTVIAAVLGECNDTRAIPLLQGQLSSVYWDVRRAAFLSLAKVGGISNLEKLRAITYESRSDTVYVMEPISFAEARLGGDFSSKSVADLSAEAESLLNSMRYLTYGQLGRMRWFLECALKNAEPRQATDILLLLTKYWLKMNDWPRVLRCVECGTPPADRSDERVLQLQVNLAAAFVLANMGSVSLRCIHSLYDQMPAPVQSAAREVIWRTLNSREFIGEDNYLWALRILFESTVARQDANLMLHDLHILARVMEPVGRKEMGSWIRYTLRVEAPGYWFGDQHDRLNYYGSPQLSRSFDLGIGEMCEEFKSIIRGQLAALLRSQPVVGPPPQLES